MQNKKERKWERGLLILIRKQLRLTMDMKYLYSDWELIVYGTKLDCQHYALDAYHTADPGAFLRRSSELGDHGNRPVFCDCPDIVLNPGMLPGLKGK